nr:uncharacterized protein LOC108123611 isoform X2 [Drosophila bipectinata]
MSFSACHTVSMNTSAPDPGGNAPPLEGGLVVTQIPIYTLNGVGPGAIPLTVGCQSMRVRCPSCKGEVDTSLLTAPTRKTHLCAMTLYICCTSYVCMYLLVLGIPGRSDGTARHFVI